MSEEIKKREELKAKINEKLDALSLEELEKIAGGWMINPSDIHDYIIIDGENVEDGKISGDQTWRP